MFRKNVIVYFIISLIIFASYILLQQIIKPNEPLTLIFYFTYLLKLNIPSILSIIINKISDKLRKKTNIKLFKIVKIIINSLFIYFLFKELMIIICFFIVYFLEL